MQLTTNDLGILENSFDFLESVEKNEKPKSKKDLWQYLEGFCFEYGSELALAVEDFFREFVEKNEKRSPSYSELIEIYNLAREYAEKKGYIFDDWEH